MAKIAGSIPAEPTTLSETIEPPRLDLDEPDGLHRPEVEVKLLDFHNFA